MTYQISLLHHTDCGEVVVAELPEVSEYLANFLEADFLSEKLTWLNNKVASKHVRCTGPAIVRGVNDPAFEWMSRFKQEALAYPTALFRVVTFKSLKEEPAYYVVTKARKMNL